MAKSTGPDETGKTEPEDGGAAAFRDEELERRRRDLEATLATRQLAAREEEDKKARQGLGPGYGQAVKLSSEFIAGIGVGAALGWVIDRFAGTSPWGLIVFLLLGFGAGVLNVLRSAGKIAEPGVRPPEGLDGPEKK